MIRAVLSQRTVTALGAILVASCAGPKVPVVERLGPAGIKPFDLVPRGLDDNGLALNPELGGSFERCELSNEKPPVPPDPAACSWRFLPDEMQPRTSRPACNSYPMDPDFSTFPLSKLGITCSDSPLRFPGHINWGDYYGGAATYEGWLTWEGYSGPMSEGGDYDFNFVLTLDDEHSLARDWDWIGIEFDSREVAHFGSPWWASLFQKAKETGPLQVQEQLGKDGAYAIVTGLLGIDAEHLSARDPAVELHPAYAVAVRVEPRAGDAKGSEHWAMFVRDQGNEGLCSHWERRHTLTMLGGAHRFRLPWQSGTKVEVDKAATTFCGNGPEPRRVIVRYDEKKPKDGVLVTVELPPGATVDGDLYLKWSGQHAAAAARTIAKRAKHRAPTRELENPYLMEQQLAPLKASPEDWRAFEDMVRQAAPECRPVPVIEQTGPLPVVVRRPGPCVALSPLSSERKALRGAKTSVVPAATVAPAAAKKDARTPRERFCAERAGKSAAAAKFCSNAKVD